MIKTILKTPQMWFVFPSSFVFWGFFVGVLQNYKYIYSIFGYTISLSKKYELVYKSISNFYFVNLTGLSFILHVVLLLSLAIQTVLVVFYFKKTKLFSSFKSGIVSVVATLIGSGCASCGGVVASFVFGTILGPTAASRLPLGGEEFMVVAIALSLFGSYYTYKKITSPLVC